MSIFIVLDSKISSGVFSILIGTIISYINLLSGKFTFVTLIFSFLIFCVAVFGIMQLSYIPISFLCRFCCNKKNGKKNERDENTPLKSAPAISLEVRKFESIVKELKSPQTEETQQIVNNYKRNIIEILQSLRIDFNVK